MAINVKQFTRTKEDVKDLSMLKESILAMAREAKESDRHATLCVDIQGGWHYLDAPITLSAVENPELLSLDITVRGKNGDRPRIYNFQRIELPAFERVEGKPYLKYQLPKDKDGNYPLFRNLFLNAISIPMAKSAMWHNPDLLTDAERKGETKRAGFYIPAALAEQIAMDALGALELTMHVEWEFFTTHIERIDLNDTCDFDGVKYVRAIPVREEMDHFCGDCHRILNIKNRETFLANSPALLTEPDTFAYDYKNGIIYLLPKDADNLTGQFVQYPSAENFLYLEGLENFTLENIEFTGTTSKHLCRELYYSGQANNVKRAGRLPHAALIASNTRNLTVRGCAFTDLGGNGVLLVNSSRGATIKDCLFDNIGMSALSIGNPTSHWEEEKNRNFNIRIENNLFRHIAYEYPTALCIFVGMVDTLKILHNTIEGCAYSAMSIGWGWEPVKYTKGEFCNVRNAEIAYNYIHNYMDVLRDGGAIYVVGGNADPEIHAERFNCMHDNYARLDVRRDGSKYGYYCDGATSNWEVRHSVIINCATPLYSQHHPLALSYHNHFFDNYSTTHHRKDFHAPGRDVLFYDCHVVEEGEDALYEEYPVAKEIKAVAGCNLKY